MQQTLHEVIIMALVLIMMISFVVLLTSILLQSIAVEQRKPALEYLATHGIVISVVVFIVALIVYSLLMGRI